MANRSKAKGTRFETQVVRYLRDALGDPRVGRKALSGAQDEGDVAVWSHSGAEGVIECKSYAQHGESDEVRWKAETVRERRNSGAAFALLVVHRPGVGEARFGRTRCLMQVRDLAVLEGTSLDGAVDPSVWVEAQLADVAWLLQGAHELPGE